MSYELAQVNIGRLAAPLDSQELAAFMAALDPVNAAAEQAPGYIWRLQTEDGNATAVRAFEWDAGDSEGVIINMSVWASVEDLGAFVFGNGLHRQIMRQRRQFFQLMREAYTTCWWVPAGHRPTPAEAEDRIRHLRAHGPSPWAFTLKTSFPPPASPEADQPVAGPADWLCPA
jgi:hypothetical protein